MRKLLLFLLIFVATVSAEAQHSAIATCTPSPTAGVTYNVYRATNTGTTLSSCPAAVTTSPWTKIGTGLTSCGFTDSTVTAGQQVCYFVTSFLSAATSTTNAGESIPSMVAIAAIPKDNVLPPTNLTIGQVSLNTTGNTSVVAADWTAPLGDSVSWKLVDDKQNPLADGYGISDGNMTWAGHREKSVTFTVCSTLGCVSKTV